MSTTEPVGASEISPVKSSEIVNSADVTNVPSAEEAVVNAGEPAVTAGEPAVTAGEPAVTAGEPAVNANAEEAIMNANAEEPSVNAEEPTPPPENTANSPEVSANVEPTPAQETPDVNATPATASPELNTALPEAPALAPIAPVKTPYTLSPSQQAVLDLQEKELREVLTPRWSQEFADIPEKYRPKPKAYDARSLASLNMSNPGDENAKEKKIQGFIERDRRATQIRMGELPRVATAPLSAPVSTEVEANSNPRNYLNSMASVKHFSPPATIFRDQVRKTREHLHKILKNTQKKLQSKAVNKNTRKAAKSLVSAFRKETDYLLREAKRQADELERAAKQRIREERHQAYERIMEHARENLKIVTGSIPTKNMTRRLAKARRNSAGRGVNTQAFVNSQSRMRKPRSYSANATNPANMDPVFV